MFLQGELSGAISSNSWLGAPRFLTLKAHGQPGDGGLPQSQSCQPQPRTASSSLQACPGSGVTPVDVYLTILADGAEVVGEGRPATYIH